MERTSGHRIGIPQGEDLGGYRWSMDVYPSQHLVICCDYGFDSILVAIMIAEEVPSKYYQQYQPRPSIIDLFG